MAQATTPRRVVHFGAYELDFATGELRKAGLRIKLQDQPFQVLAMLRYHSEPRSMRDGDVTPMTRDRNILASDEALFSH